LRERLPWVSLGTLPTPIEQATGLGQHLGIRSLWVKRDDLSGEAYGGGKVRKLELLLGEAKRTRAQTVITFGGVGSNHAVATAIYAAQLGMRAVLALLPEPPDERVRTNLLADLAAGAELHLSSGRDPLRITAWRARANEHGALYAIAAGGSSPLGNVGFVNAAFELKDQIDRGEMPEPDDIYLAMGTMGAAVGLAIGLRAAGLGTRVVAVRASSPETSSERRLLAMAAETAGYLRGLDASLAALDSAASNIAVADGYLGAGYGRPTAKARAAIRLARDLAGLDLEHVYTGKALAALIDRAPRSSNRVVLFWNTHNSREMALQNADPRDLPAAFRGYFAGWRDAPR
jgi:D-cysteine desulfhydrase